MTDSFSLSPQRCAETSDPSLRREITDHTGNETITSGILRSIERFGDDSSIDRYEITRSERGRYAPKTQAASWVVRAVRSSGPAKA